MPGEINAPMRGKLASEDEALPSSSESAPSISSLFPSGSTSSFEGRRRGGRALRPDRPTLYLRHNAVGLRLDLVTGPGIDGLRVGQDHQPPCRRSEHLRVAIEDTIRHSPFRR